MMSKLLLIFSTFLIVYIYTIESNYLLNLFITIAYIYALKTLFNKKLKKRNDKKIEENHKIIATITHDLKTPAVAQIRAIELLLKGNFGEITDLQRNFLTDILSSCNTMLDMLVNMLWLYKFDNNFIALNLSAFCINDLITEILKENKLSLNSKNIEFENNFQTAKIYITADKMHIKRVISNLLMNAVNYSKNDTSIKITTELKENIFVFKVKNYGKLIPNELLNCISDKNNIFNQRSEGLSTGLGLYLTNSLLKLNNGELIHNSTIHGENTFGFTINMKNKKYDNRLIKNVKSEIIN